MGVPFNVLMVNLIHEKCTLRSVERLLIQHVESFLLLSLPRFAAFQQMAFVTNGIGLEESIFVAVSVYCADLI